MFSLLFPGSIGALITGRGRVEPCLRRIFRDPSGLGFGWIRPDFTLLGVSTCPYRHFVLMGGDFLHRCGRQRLLIFIDDFLAATFACSWISKSLLRRGGCLEAVPSYANVVPLIAIGGGNFGTPKDLNIILFYLWVCL